MNVASGAFSAVVGGDGNIASGSGAMAGGGSLNTASALFATVAGGLENNAIGTYATVSGGVNNTANGQRATISGGENNTASSQFATIGGGSGNLVNDSYATVGGGLANSAQGLYAVVGGGQSNSAGGFSAVPGGRNNSAQGQNSFAAGYLAAANNSYAFVWGGSSSASTSSSNNNSFTVRAPGGARFLSTSNSIVGAILNAGATDWAALSDSNAKTDIAPVNAREVLKKVAALPVTSWHYKHNLDRRYIGPMAQDFHAAFGLGVDDKTISTLDTDGVTLAAIQGLVEELKERDAEIAGLKARNSQIEGQLREINQRLDRLPPAP
jgi:hypothetical protein